MVMPPVEKEIVVQGLLDLWERIVVGGDKHVGTTDQIVSRRQVKPEPASEVKSDSGAESIGPLLLGGVPKFVFVVVFEIHLPYPGKEEWLEGREEIHIELYLGSVTEDGICFVEISV